MSGVTLSFQLLQDWQWQSPAQSSSWQTTTHLQARARLYSYGKRLFFYLFFYIYVSCLIWPSNCNFMCCLVLCWFLPFLLCFHWFLVHPRLANTPLGSIIEWQRLTCTLPKTLWFWFGKRLYRKENLQSGPVGQINSTKFFHNYTAAQRQGQNSASHRALSVKQAFCSLALTPHRCTHWVIVTKRWCGFCGRKTCKWDKSIAWHKMQWGGSSVKAYLNIF